MLARVNGLVWLAGATAMSLSLSHPVRAAGDPAAGDPVIGEKKFYTCFGCHGSENYRNAYPDYSVPKLRHQFAPYIIAALQEYKSGDRPFATMHAQAASLSDQDMQDIAAYLQDVEAVKPSAAVAGTVPKQVAACAACHGENGLGVAAPIIPKPPILAGQHADYLEQALISYRNGRRKNVIMAGMAKLLATDEDVKIVADYFARQPAPLATAKAPD